MATARSAFRTHIGKALGPLMYASSTTTAASSTNSEIVDSKRTEGDEFWDGATVRISSQDVPVRGGTGANTGRTPTILLDQALTGIPAISTNYELLKTWTFQDVDEAIDDALAEMWPYFWDGIDDISTALVDQVIEYAMDPSWKQIVRIQQQIPNSTPLRYGTIFPGVHYDLVYGATTSSIILRWIPGGQEVGTKLRVFARAVPTLGAADTATSVQPWQVVVPGALAYLYRKGAVADAGTMSNPWLRKAQENERIFETRRLRMAMPTPRIETDFPVVRVGR